MILNFLPAYHEHVSKNPQSLLARIYGVFQVEMEGVVPVNLMLMANTIKTLGNKKLKTYDLKGSWNNRIVRQGENQTMKDRNLLSCKASRARKGERGILQFRKEDI